jgi:hypothetical protein
VGDGSLLATADGSLALWNIDKGAFLGTFSSAGSRCDMVTAGADGGHLACAAPDGATLWRVDDKFGRTPPVDRKLLED